MPKESFCLILKQEKNAYQNMVAMISDVSYQIVAR